MPAHPAKYSKELLPVLQAVLRPVNGVLLDCMGGVGGVHALRRNNLYTVATELEHEWAKQHPSNINANALQLPFRDNTFDAACVSPTYGNRMADHHNAKDNSVRNTYTHKLGRQLHDDNSGKMQWGAKYRTLHEQAWPELLRVLKPGRNARFVLNVSNHIRKGEEIDVAGWHVDLIESLGMHVHEHYEVRTRRNRQGSNSDARVPFEHVFVFMWDNPVGW